MSTVKQELTDLIERQPEDSTREEIILAGEVPSPINPPRGCRFHPRCPFVMPQCAEVEPPLTEMGGEHLVACHLY